MGAALIAVLRNGMTLFDLTTQTQAVLTGLVLVTAIVTDNYFNPREPRPIRLEIFEIIKF